MIRYQAWFLATAVRTAGMESYDFGSDCLVFIHISVDLLFCWIVNLIWYARMIPLSYCRFTVFWLSADDGVFHVRHIVSAAHRDSPN